MNTRFREVAEGLTVEMMATRVEMTIHPARPDDATAIWWGREFQPMPTGHVEFGARGDRLETPLSNYSTTIRTIWDPVLQQHVTLSAPGWVVWGKDFYDHAHNVVNTPEPLEPEEEVEMEP